MPNSKLPAAVLSLYFVYEQVNAAWCTAHNVPAEAFLGKPAQPLSLYDFDVIQKIDMDKVLHGEHQMLTETVKNGSLKSINWQIVPIKQNGIVTSFGIVQHSDSSETQEKINLQQDLQNLYTNGPLGLVHTDVEGNILRANSVFCRMVGYTEQELVGMKVDEISTENPFENQVGMGVQAYHNGETGTNIKKRYIRKDGSKFWAKVWLEFCRASPEAQNQGLKDYVIGIIESIQEQELSNTILENLWQINQVSDSFLQEVVKNICKSLDVPCATILFCNAKSVNATIKAAYTNQTLEAERMELLAMLPCKNVVDTHRPYFVSNNFSELYPHIYLQTPKDAVGYAAVPILNKQNEVIGTISVIDNKPITEQKIIENTLRIYTGAVSSYLESEKHKNNYQLLAENINDLICLHAPNSKILYASQSFYKLTGYHSHEVIGKYVRDFILSESLASYDEQVEKLIENNYEGYIQYQIKHKKTSEIRWIESNIKPVFNEKNVLVNFVGSTRDITVYKEAEARLKQSKIDIREAIENNDLRIFSLDTNYCYKVFNKNHASFVKQFTGYDIQVGKCIFDYSPNEAIALRAKINLDRAMQGEIHTTTEDYSQPNNLLFFEINFRPSFNTEGVVNGVSVFSKNITQQVVTDRKIAQKESELFKINQELETFFYRSSHDYGAPINTMQGLLNIWELEETAENNKIYVGKARITLSHLESRTRNVARYAYNKQQEIKHEPIDLEKFIKTANRVIKTRIFVEDMPDACIVLINPMAFCSDKVRLGNILHCLIANAYKFAKPNDPNWFLEIEVKITAKEATFVFRDNGQGIAPQELPKIFDMFVRSNEKSQGAGIGLFVVKETVHALNAGISVSSELGVGSSFVLTIPNMAQKA